MFPQNKNALDYAGPVPKEDTVACKRKLEHFSGVVCTTGSSA